MTQLNPLTFTQQPKPRRPILGGYLQQGAITSLIGPKSSFKSTTAYAITNALIRGDYFGDTQADGDSNVLFFTAAPQRAIGRLDELSEPDDRAAITVVRTPSLARTDVELPDGSAGSKFRDAYTRKLMSDLDDHVGANGRYTCLVIDRMAPLADGYRINDDAAAYHFGSALKRLLRFADSILLVDTSTHYSTLRGSAVLTDFIDIDLRITRFVNARQRITDPKKESATLVCHSTAFGDYPASCEIALSSRAMRVSSQPIDITNADADAVTPDFLTPTQRYEMDHLLRLTANMTSADILNLGRIPRADQSANGKTRYIEGAFLERLNDALGQHLHQRRDVSMLNPEFLKRALAHHRERLVHNPMFANSQTEETNNDDF